MKNSSMYLSVIGVVVITVALAGCGSSPIACQVRDVSGSTVYANADYDRAQASEIRSVAESGGTVRVVVAGGNPMAESTPITRSFTGLNGSENSQQREQQVESLEREIENEVQRAQQGGIDPKAGSGVAAAIVKLSGEGGCGTLTAYSDGVETADAQFPEDISDEGDIDNVLEKFSSGGLIPDLNGSTLSMPFGGYVPQTGKLDAPAVQKIKKFWSAYAERADASFKWGS